jgi:hypothetical protein
VLPVQCLQVEYEASIMGFPAFFSKTQAGPASITFKFKHEPDLQQFKIALQPNLYESAA